MALLNISGKSSINFNGNSPVLVEFAKNDTSSFEKELIKKDIIISFLLKERGEPEIRLVNDRAVKTI